MSEDKETKKENGEQPEKENQGEEVEGYAYCASMKERCLSDCAIPAHASPILTDLN